MIFSLIIKPFSVKDDLDIMFKKISDMIGADIINNDNDKTRELTLDIGMFLRPDLDREKEKS